MRLKSNIELNYNDGLTTNATAIVIGEIISVSYLNDFTKIGVNYKYILEDGTILKIDAFYLESEAEINGMHAMIVANLPAYTNEADYTRTKFYEGFKLQMSQTFQCLPSNLDIDIPIIEE